ncbi:vacuolar protein sorting-associated protein 13C isoform X1 [Chiroxiphia lanceolata]|uniref:vacuolar protein sorting-associated protein 13C isoform X1 n=1 Tax=Chiroxiphia lanceolata TaxID=296741 RepID=UPI0013CED56F|nr:vacuolar protein sorting-associated protein 13C isoform X1 [Chiroxiphia lanceolata]XP_032555501.1 vacuolar protein sorting-associated protein 13C isoform X1 [Chiroxiphia lanceolata]
MVLESVVADLLNRFLGDYVENLNKSQLKLGIWGGNVALDNLQIKENALSELDVPFRIKVGQIDKLTLKIPWKNLYGEAVVATLEGLYLLIVPGASVKYDAEKEEKYLQDNKQKELARIEEALQKAAEKGTHSQDSLYGLESLVYKDTKPGRKRKKYKKHFKRPFKGHDHSKDKPKEEKKDTFLEKLATQVIKNVQVKITGIHVKYEDDITDPQCPISLGMTLGELSLLTTNENWKPSILNEAAKIIYKLLCLDSLSAYWNVHSTMYYHGSREQILDQLKRGIPCGGNQPKDYQYIFRPVSASARLYINPYAEVELKTPKIDCNVEVQRIVIEFTKPQYLSMIDLLESVDYMVRNAPYRRFRPGVPLHKHAGQWWKYAGDSVLEVHIRRHTRMWSWSNIKQHRQLLKSYKNTYKNKLTQSKLSEETQRQIQDLERQLDVFNIILARQQAQVETIRSGQKLLKKKSTEVEKKSGGWFGGFWGRRESRKKEDEESPVPETIDELMTPEEKAKLFTAIGYSDSSHNLSLPKQYVAHVVTLKLLSTSLTIKEDQNVAETLKVQIIDLSTKISQRPGAQAIKVEAKLENWYVTGLRQDNIVPSLVASIGDSKSSLLKIEFNTNPEDSPADQSLSIESQPVEIKYDARTINAMVEFFQTSKGMDLERLTTATLMKLEEIKERTATGLVHIIEMRKVLDLKINLKPSYLVVPQTGFYQENSDLLILDFGTFQLNSINQGSSETSSFSSLEEIMDKAYDKFDVEIKNVQLLFGRTGEDWKKARFQHPSTLHVLQPMDIHVQLAKSMVERDTRMPKFKVSGGLPLVHVRLSDQKIKAIFDLIDSIPLPQKSSVSAPSTKVPAIPTIPVVSKGLLRTPQLLAEMVSDSEEEYFDFEESSEPTDRSLIKGEEIRSEEPAQEELTDLQLKFEIKEVLVELTKQKKTEETVLVFDVMHLGTEATVRTYNLAAVSYLKKISLDYYEIGGKKTPIHLISSSDKPGLDLLKVEYIKADRNGPQFQTAFDNTEQMIQVTFSSLNLLLHTEALLSALSFLTTVSPSGSESRGDTPLKEKQEDDTRLKKVARPSKDKDVFDFKVFAKLDAFCLNICDEKKNIAEIKIQGLDSSLCLQPSHTVFFARLKDIVVTDVDSRTLHKKAVSIVGDEVFSFNLTLNPHATEGEAYTDMSKVDGSVSLRVGCIQIVFLHKFLMALLTFLNNFQTAKEALSAATAQAAEKAATSVKDLAQRSFRLAMDIHLKAPVIVIPQSSVSPKAIVIDLGLIRVQNQFSLVAPEGSSLPPVIDKMDVQLTKLKLSRTTVETDLSHPDIQILHPINLSLSVKRNLSAAWFHKLPVLEITGYLDTMNVVLSQEDLNVFLRVLTENLGEAEEKQTDAKSVLQKEGKTKEMERSVLVQGKSGPEGMLSEKRKEPLNEDVINVLLNFEIKEVVITLMKQIQKERYPLHILTVLQLGTETKVRNHELTAAAYLKKIVMRCTEIKDSKGDPLCIINSSSETDEHLLKMEYIKADPDGPDFVTTYKSTKQNINVIFSSLDIVLHTEALLSILSFLTFSVPSGGLPSAEKSSDHKPQTKEEEKGSALRPVCGGAAHDDICELKLTAKLNAFGITVCDQTCRIADIRIQGMDASVAMKPKKIKVFSRLEDIVITNVDPKTVHKKAVSIMGDEVFRFHVSLYPDATAGEAYTDMSRVDGKMSLKVGCIQIIYLHKFFMSLLNFLNNFQTAQEALTAVTAQAAEMAASSMKDFARKSFRLCMDVNLKAPVIVIPESPASYNALVADLGLIRVQNEFKLVSSDESPLPPVIDSMDVQLTHLKLSRCIISTDSQPDSEILCPVSLTLLVQRNLAATWYHKCPTICIKGDLKPMQIALSEDDLTVIMKILLENLGGASSQPAAVQENVEFTQIPKKGRGPHESGPLLASEQKSVSTAQSSVECYTALKFDFNFESLSVILYNSDKNQSSLLPVHSDRLRLGELRLHLMASSGDMFSDGSMDIKVKLKACTLDDLREGIQNVTARMIDKKDDTHDSSMIDIRYKQDKNGTGVVAVLDKLYICASMEFLLTVADFFINSMPASSTERSAQFQLKQVASGKSKPETEIPVRPNMTVKAVILDPEVVFVANLTNADAPALKVSFQCDFSLTSGRDAQRMTAQVNGFKVLACAFLKEKQDKSVTTVLRPCSLVMENMVHVSGLQTVAVTIEELTIKISPIILNTVITIMAAIKPKATEEDSRGAAEVSENLWQVKPIDECNAWFLGVDVATEATETYKDREQILKQEKFDIVVKSVQMTLECGLGHRTVPLLLVESAFSGVLKNWSSLMEVAADTSLEIHYYNETYAVWEPLIERIEGGKKQWNLKLEMKTNPVQERSLMPGDDFIVLPEPQTAINISSKDTMNITISKCCLAVFSNLAKAFSEATASTFDYSFKETAPFIVKNALGVPLKVLPSSSFRIVGSTGKEKLNDIEVGQSMELEYSAFEAPQRGRLSALYRQESSVFSLNLELQGYKEALSIPIAKPGRRLYNVRSLAGPSDSIIVQIDATEGNKVITVRSPLQIKNHFSIPFMIYKLAKGSKVLEAIGTSRPEEEFHVPLHSYRCQLYVRPTGVFEGQFRESTTYIAWREELHRSTEVKCLLQCPAMETSFLPLIISSTAVPDELSFISPYEEEWDPAYIIHLYPTLTVRNLLPYSLRYLLEGTAEARELTEGSAADVFHSRLNGEIMELVLLKYQGKDWNGHLKIHDGMPEFFPVCFTSHSAASLTVDVYIHTRRVGSRLVLSVFSPYWIINKTSRVLQYRAEDTHVKHPADYRDIVLFSFKKKNIFSKNKIQLCISTSTWSSSFSLDTVGSYGCVRCSANNMDYLVGVSIKMSSFNLTRIVTFTPFYTIANKSSLELEVGEIGPNGSLPTNKWNYISASECLPFWPENSSGELCVRVVGYESPSKPFLFNAQDNGTLLRLEELNGGVLVDVNVSEHSTLISFSDYHEGAAPALIVNHTPWDCLRYRQSGLQEEMELKPRQVCLFAWTDPTKPRKLTWGYCQNFGEHDLLKDDCGQFPYNANTQIHWVSFLDGRQRVLLFTDDVALVSKARQAEELEQPDQEINLSIHGLGLSLVNNENKKEISYIGITSSGVVWERKPRHKWKPFNQKQINLLEQAYQKYLSKTAFQGPGWHKLDSNTEVNFSKFPMEMRLPVRCSIRRNFLSGIQVEFKQSPHQRSLRAQLYWLQVDNQLPGSMFPVVFHPVLPPKSIALDSEPKPFIDISVITRFNEYSKVLQFKYFMVLIQEMALKIDQGFLGALSELFTPSTDPEAERQRSKLIQQDVDALNTELMESSLTDLSMLSFFEHFHISPIKLHLSLSLASGGEASDKGEDMIAIHSLNLLLKSIGATLTDVDDVIFKLAFFEIKYQFYKRDQLMKRVVRHYSEQFLKQMYVLVLGLDVLGNPFGLIRGLSEGVEAFFYEPFQGAVQGPEEFAEGFVIGVRSLLGHTVGGAAGVVSRITGTVGKGLAAITLDEEFQQKRREEMGRQPKDFGESLAKGGKGLLRGVVGGVTGIITKPVEGAKKEGAAGFFKGIGKGLVGVVARPTGGIVDMASSTFQGIQRVAESTEEVSNLRPPRLIREDGIIRPYDRVEAEGYDLFEKLHIKKLEKEMYRYHCALPRGRRANLIVTNRRVIYVKEMEILGHLTIEWDHLFEEFTRCPSYAGNILKLTVLQDQRMFHRKDSTGHECVKAVQLQDETTARWICGAIQEAQATRNQQKLVKRASLQLKKPQMS